MAYSRIFVDLWRLKDEDIRVLHTDVNAVTVIFISRATRRMLWVFLAGNFVATLLIAWLFYRGTQSNLRKRRSSRHSTTGVNDNVVVAETSYQM